MIKRNLKLLLEYDGTEFHGWQFQPERRTVQGVLREAISKIEDLPLSEIKLIGASRTDAGVHAVGQVANFFSRRRISPANYRKALNSILPEDLVVKGIEEVELSFNARRDARGKWYRYIVLNSDYPSALERKRVFFFPHKVDVDLMREIGHIFVGKKDFSSFRASGSDAKSSIREIFSLIIEKHGDYIYFDIRGSGFLKQMVRNIVGTLLWVGIGKIQPEELESIFSARDRRKAGPTAPAHGLYLMEVEY